MTFETDEYGKPLSDAYLEIIFKAGLRPYYRASGVLTESRPDGTFYILRFAYDDIKAIDPNNAAGFTISTNEGVVCYSWDIIREHWVQYNSEEYKLAILEFQDKCEHTFANAVHNPLGQGCYQQCVTCDKTVNPHKESTQDCPTDIVDRNVDGT